MKTITLILGTLTMMATLGQLTAQTFTTLCNFEATSSTNSNSDGSHPHGALLLSGNTLYGTTWQGGTNGNGVVFAAHTAGTGFTNLHTFSAISKSTNYDGANPQAGLIISGTTLYGTASKGGLRGFGTVFALNADGAGFTNLYSFTGGNDGANPCAGLVLSGSTLFGTTTSGGNGAGTVFAIKTDGTGLTNLHTFTALNNSTNSEGANPYTGLILSGDTLYGTASHGGSSGSGSILVVKTDGTGFTNIYTFTALNNGTNTDGATSYAGLVLSGNTLFGMAYRGGTSGYGTVFAVNTDGTGFTNLHSFTATIPPGYTNADGAYPNGGYLALCGDTLYGSVTAGGNGAGTVFAVNTDSTGFTPLHRFSWSNDGGDPWAGLVLAGTTLYGTANFGGLGGQWHCFQPLSRAATGNHSFWNGCYRFMDDQCGRVHFAVRY